MEQKQKALFKPAPKKQDETASEEIVLPDITKVIKESKKALKKSTAFVCRVCGREDCYVAPRIQEDEYVAGKYNS